MDLYVYDIFNVFLKKIYLFLFNCIIIFEILNFLIYKFMIFMYKIFLLENVGL